MLHCDDLVELVGAARQRQDVFVAKRWQAECTYAAVIREAKNKDLKNTII